MLRAAASGGTEFMVATPHGDHRRAWDDIGSLGRLCEELNGALQHEQVRLTVALGIENPLVPDIVERIEQGAGLTINGSNYILVELPFLQLPLYWEEVLFQLQLHDLHPIIAHPERQAQLQANPKLVADVVNRGVMTQVTAGSLAGRFWPKVKKTAESLLKRDLVHVIASDCHGAAGSRDPGLKDGLRAAAKLVGQELASQMVLERPRAIAGTNMVPGVVTDTG